MICNIMVKELLNNMKSLRLSLTLILMVISMSISGLVFSQKYHQMLEDYSRDVNTNLQKTYRMVKSINDLAFHPFCLYKSPNPLRLCADGRERYIPNSFEISIVSINGMENRSRVNFMCTRLEDLDWALIISVIASFTAIILTYDSISGERESGTLKLVMSNSVSRASLIIGKYLGAAISLFISLAVAIALSLLIIVTLGVDLTSQQWGSIGMILLVSVIYISFFIFLGLFVSSITKSSTTSLVILLFLWTIFIAIIPSSSRVIGEEIRPLTPKRTIDERITNTKWQVLDHYPSDTYNWEWDFELPVPKQVIRRGKAMWEIAEKQDQIRDSYRKEMLHQLNLIQNLMRVSPMMVYTLFCEGVTGNGKVRFENFMNQVREFQNEWREWIFAEDAKDKSSFHILSSEKSKRPYSLKEPDYGLMPRFFEELPSLKDSLRSASLDLFILVLLNVTFFMLSYLVFMRSSLR